MSTTVPTTFCLTNTGIPPVYRLSLCESHFPNGSLLLPLLLLFYKGLSCVLSSNPFKILCTFLHDGSPDKAREMRELEATSEGAAKSAVTAEQGE